MTTGSPNIYTYNGTAFTAVTDMSTSLTAGTGFIVYVFSDEDNSTTPADVGFPKTLDVTGGESQSTVTPTLTSGADAWTLLGNTFAAALDADNVFEGMANLNSAVYVWDPASGGTGAYVSWNGTVGSLSGGLISPFQGFWVQNDNTGNAPSLSLEVADKSTGASFYKASTAPVIHLRAAMGDVASDLHISFTENGEVGRDTRDALHLMPLNNEAGYANLGVRLGEEILAISNLPLGFDSEIRQPIRFAAYEPAQGGWASVGGRAELSLVSAENLPADWSVELLDNRTGARIPLDELDTYRFEAEPVAFKSVPKDPIEQLIPTPEAGVSSEDRFTLVVRSATSVAIEPGTEGGTLPEAVTLAQNYPNPFNPSTQIRFSLPQARDVSLRVFDLLGREMAAPLRNRAFAAGWHMVDFDAANLPSGTYLYRLETGSGAVLTRQMTLLK